MWLGIITDGLEHSKILLFLFFQGEIRENQR